MLCKDIYILYLLQFEVKKVTLLPATSDLAALVLAFR